MLLKALRIGGHWSDVSNISLGERRSSMAYEENGQNLRVYSINSIKGEHLLCRGYSIFNMIFGDSRKQYFLKSGHSKFRD
jgi:hypothetical protein